jgi:diguanylate cyclase (GGDEF)-like protein/PAS domain S-box-containing protein
VPFRLLANAFAGSPRLDAGVWARRHRGLRTLMAVQGAVVVAVSALAHAPAAHTLTLLVLIAGFWVLSGSSRAPRRVQECVVALGLFTASAGIVELTHGDGVAHFHYFVMLPFLALYEDGFPFAVGVLYIVVQHGLMGSMAPEMVFSRHGGEDREPWLWAGLHGAAVLAASIGQRIHWRASQAVRASDRASRRTAERYFERAGTMLVDLDADGRVRAANPASCAVLGRTRDELVGADWFEIALGAGPSDPIRAHYRDVVQGRRPVAAVYDNVLTTADGAELTVSWQSELLTDEQGVITGLLCSGTDVTARRRAEAALEQSRNDLSALHRLAQTVAGSDDGRQAVVEHVGEMIGAAWVVLVEVAENERTLTVTTSTPGCPLLGAELALDGEPSVAARVYRTGEATLIADVGGEEAVSSRLHRLVPDSRSIYYLPVTVAGGVGAVLAVGWNVVVPSVAERRAALVALAAQEAGIALERRKALQRLERIAVTDPLTQLPNRRMWERELPLAMARAQRSGAPLAVAVLDLNEFKALNDSEGHDAGDRLLQAAAAGWQDALRITDLLVRFGGDEFAVLLPECAPEHADTVAGRLKAAVPHAAGVSVGVVIWDGAETADQLLKRADAALYADKALCREARIADAARLRAVAATGLVGAEDTTVLDELTRAVADLLDAPVALVSLVDDVRQHFVGMSGLHGWAAEARGTELSHSFCRHTVSTGRSLVVSDARAHPLVEDNLAIRDLDVHAYAGVPLTTPDGHALGALCAIDDHAREWTPAQVATLEAIAAQLSTRIAPAAAAV